MADINPAFVQQVFDAPKRKWEPDVHIIARRMISELVLEYLKEAGLIIAKRYAPALLLALEVNLTKSSSPTMIVFNLPSNGVAPLLREKGCKRGWVDLD